MQIAVVAAGFTPSEADRLRRSLATFKRMGTIGGFRDRFFSGMLARGYDALERAVSFCSVLNRDEIDRLTHVRSNLTSALVYALWHRAIFADLELLRDLIVLHPLMVRFILTSDPVFLPANEQEWGMFAAAFAVANVHLTRVARCPIQHLSQPEEVSNDV